MRFLFIFLSSFLLSSCNLLKDKDTVLAKVGDNLLYYSEVVSLIQPSTTPKDSANIVQRYINNWLRKQLLMQQAKSLISDADESEIEKKVNEYRQQLYIYYAEKKFVEEFLDTTITYEQIKEYYDSNQSNFELKQNIIQGIFVKIPKEIPYIHKIRIMLQTTQPPRETLAPILAQYTEEFFVTDTNWIYIDELLFGTPLAHLLKNQTETLRASSFFEAKDENYIYMLRVLKYKFSNEISPLNLVEKNIRNILINKRKIELRQQYEREIFEKSVQGKDYEILVSY
ncbi:MAG: hypothetical protein NZM38_03125 [Cytophagales bacterium]|nr:hypothetical protein [Cytophagales bacterium]MDW8383745.1 hypothetical protein [Flammeovirgaceae bacterium]